KGYPANVCILPFPSRRASDLEYPFKVVFQFHLAGFVDGQVIIVFFDSRHSATATVNLLPFVWIEGVQFLLQHAPGRLDCIDVALAYDAKTIGNPFASGDLLFLKVFPQLKLPDTYLAFQGVWRQGFNVNIPSCRIEGFEILQAVVAKEAGVFGHPVLDHFPRHTRNMDAAFGKRIEGGFIDLKPRPSLTIDFNLLGLDIG